MSCGGDKSATPSLTCEECVGWRACVDTELWWWKGWEWGIGLIDL